MNNNWYIIKDLDDFTEHTRILVFNNFANHNDETSKEEICENLSEDQRNELDSVLSFDECMVITKTFAKKQRNKNTKEIRYAISDDIFSEIVSSMNSRMVSNLLVNLSKRGLIESAYDNKLNDFVFWTVNPKSSEDSSN